MSKPTTPSQPTTRRLSLAISAAATSMTIAIGVTAASLLGWFGPAALRPATPAIDASPAVVDVPPPVLLVPIVPAAPAAEPPVIVEPADRGGVQLALLQDDDHDRDDDDEEDEDEDEDEDDEGEEDEHDD